MSGTNFVGSAQITFKASPTPPNGSVGLMGIEGQPISSDPLVNPHLFRAVCLDIHGNPLTGTVKWQLSQQSETNYMLLADETPIPPDGIAVNGMSGSGGQNYDYNVQAVVPNNLAGNLPVSMDTFPKVAITLGTNGLRNLVSAYPGTHDNVEMLWTVYPADQVTLENQTTEVGSDGLYRNTITGVTGEAPFTAYLAASTFNPQLGTRDYSYTLPRRFIPPSIVIDKPYAQLPPNGSGVSTRFPDAVVKCQIQNNWATGTETLYLLTDQPVSTITVLNADGHPISSGRNGYPITTNGTDPTTFYVGSGTQTRLDLYMQWNGKNLPRASLAFADNDPSANASLTAPTIKELTGTVLNIPTGCPVMP
ncbi:hypothetical protein, partial [Brucella sp. SA075A]